MSIRSMLDNFIIFLKQEKVEKKVTNNHLYRYSESMEEHKNKEPKFILPFVQKRYDEINTALKYTKHSKKREKLLKAKKHYDSLKK